MNNDTEYFHLSETITDYATGVISIIGFIGNLISAYILSRREFFTISMFKYFFIGIIFQSLQIANVLNISKKDWFKDSLLNLYSCKFSLYIWYANRAFINWIQLVTSIDRYIGIKFPQRFQFREKTQFVSINLFLILSLFLAVYSPIFFYVQIIDPWCLIDDQDVSLLINFSDMVVSVLTPFFYPIRNLENIFLKK